MGLTQWETLCGLFFCFFEKIVVPILTSGGIAAVSSSFFAALCSAFGRYDVVHIHAEGPAFFAWLPKMFGKRVVVTVHGIDWQREKWQSGFGSKFIRQGEKNAVKYADEIIVLSKGVQDYFKETYDRETHFVPNGVNFQYHYPRLYGALWCMNNTLEVLHLNRGSEIEHKRENTGQYLSTKDVQQQLTKAIFKKKFRAEHSKELDAYRC